MLEKLLMDLILIIINTFVFLKVAEIINISWGWIVVPYIFEFIVLYVERKKEEVFGDSFWKKIW